MNVSLTKELEKFIHGKVDSGFYQNASEVVRAALRQMREDEVSRDHQLAWLRREVDRGWDEAQSGQLTPSSQVEEEMAEFKRRWRERRLSDPE